MDTGTGKTAAILSEIERPKTFELVPEEVVISNAELPLENESVEELSSLNPLVETGELYFIDPRPDLEDDTGLWTKMLAEAEKTSKRLQKHLWDMRVWGTRLVRGKRGIILRPDVDPRGATAWNRLELYEKWRDKLLLPYKVQIAEILKLLELE